MNGVAHVRILVGKDHCNLDVRAHHKKPRSVMHRHVHHQQVLGGNGTIGLAALIHAMTEHERELEHVRSMVDVREPILKTKSAT